ncbi:Sensory/regulatory protein RpfC [Paenibacillus konkukensis]|uniref:histidine kinase n=2 Tax=Paenibacillus konkukensis TaxID=2020716 RepID=A0ABY4RTZ2_9BACL|nr:Sensory/regulatory protein RpfC [Paenibacillus konkukensis]
MTMLPKQKMKPLHIIYMVLLTALLVTVRWLWHDGLSQPDTPKLQQGLLDLRGIALENSRPLPLDGEWQFCPEQWVGSGNMDQAAHGRLLPVPGNWNAMFGERSYGYGTYYARIKLKQPLTEPVSLWFQAVNTASEIEINGKVLARFGKLSESKQGHAAESRSSIITYAPMQEGITELNLFVRTANYESPTLGGIVRSVQFGTQAAVSRIYSYSAALQLITITIFLLHALYALILYFMNGRKAGFTAYFLTMTVAALTIGTYHSKLAFQLFEAGFAWEIKLRALSYIWFAFFLLLMGRNFYGARHKGVLFWSYAASLAGYTLFIAAGPQEAVLYSLEKKQFMLWYYFPALWTAYYFIKMVMNRIEGAFFLLFAVICVLNNMIWGALYYAATSQFMFYPIDIIMGITSFSAHWFIKYFHHYKENEQLNVKLAEANRLKDRFLANTSHELRTPLHGIINIAGSVLKRQKQVLDTQAQRDMELLVKIGRRMSHTLNDLLDVVRLRDKQVKLHWKEVQVQSLAAGVTDMLRFLTEGSAVELRASIPEHLPPVYADEERLVQVLINLAHNALKFTEAGLVELGAEQCEGQVRIYVRDTGTGMDEALQSRIFQRYEQGHSDRGGLGLGLSICQELIELHGSKLLLRSEPGKGSEFSFALPVAGKAAPPPVSIVDGLDEELPTSVRKLAAAGSDTLVPPVYHAGDIEPAPLLAAKPTSIRVLAVDDDPVNLKVLVQLLSAESYHIDTARSGREALDKLHGGQWDLIIADVMMPGMSGYELTKHIRTRFTLYELPVLLLTARSMPEDVYAGFLAGANDYVTKPVDGPELLYRAWSLASQKQAINERLRMEAAYLQAQIHPHFLFNTLNSIIALSDIDAEKMKELADAFTSYLRISFGFLTAGELVPLRRELKLVEHYLYIERQRFGERLSVEWEIADGIEVPVPPLALQPLVENAVRHGILSLSRGGTVRVRIERRSGHIHFSVSDTGIGMSAEQAEALLHPADRDRRGIGLFNTHSRLVRLYGRGLHVHSVPGQGTTVSFTVPG